uniref:SH3 domain containing 19 n=1 Tax=Echeneis naucrates TaxID=173247 RepID=A0A665THA5_ECHNA
EITIVSAEPLASNSCFPGSSVVFPPPQAGWPAGIQPPPSYDQVIQEKTQEENIFKPTAAPRRISCSPSSATQTDSVREDTSTNTVPSTAVKRSAGKTPQKPPRPTPPKPVDRKLTETVTPNRNVGINNVAANQKPSQHPVPLPRTKSRKQSTPEEVKVQSLVHITDNCDSIHLDAAEVSSNKYLKELLEVFSPEDQCEEKGDITTKSHEASQGEDAVSEMSNSHRDIRSKIQAFENQAKAEEGSVTEPGKPEPRPRKPTIKPPVAAKPSVAVKPQSNPSAEDLYQNVSTSNMPPNHTPAQKPQPPEKLMGLSIKGELEILHSKAANPDRPRPVLTRAQNINEEESLTAPAVPPTKPLKEPLKPNLNLNNHNSASIISESEYVNSQSHNQVCLFTDHFPVKPQGNVDSNGGSFPKQSVARRPTTIRVPSKTGSCESSKTFHSLKLRQSTMKVLPPRPPPAKAGPGRPPPPSLKISGRSQSAPWDSSPKPQAKRPPHKGPVLPPRPNPGHRLYNKYILELPHGIAALDYHGNGTGELSFQKNEVLLLLKEIDKNTFECQVGDRRGQVHKSRMKIIMPLTSDKSELQVTLPSFMSYFTRLEGELSLRAGDVVTMVEKVDSDWYRGTCRGSTGFFPISYVKVLGEHSDELSFSEGDVILLKEYIGQEWARGQLGVSVGIFPLNFVEVIEDLPPPEQQVQTQPSRIALPGTTLLFSSFCADLVTESMGDWAVALYDYAGNSEGDLSFQQGDSILITRHINDEWSSGRLNGREGLFPSVFVESTTGIIFSKCHFLVL